MKHLILAALLSATPAFASISTYLNGEQGQTTIKISVQDARLKAALRDVFLKSPYIRVVDNMYVEKNTAFTGPGIHLTSRDESQFQLHLTGDVRENSFVAEGNFIRLSGMNGIANTLINLLSTSKSPHVLKKDGTFVVMATPGNYINPSFSCRMHTNYTTSCELRN